MNYICKVVDNNGIILEKNIDANTIEELNNDIFSKELTLLSFKKNRYLRNNKLSKNEILQFTLTIKLLLNSNLSILDALEISLKTFKDKNLIIFTETTIRRLKSGDNFWSILRDSNKGFTPLYLGLIQVGEQSGDLTLIIEQLYDYLHRGKKFRDKLLSALIYPLFILIMTIAFSILFLLVILPKFNEMFTTLGGGLGNILDQRAQILTVFVILTTFVSLLIFSIVIYSKKIKKIDINKSINIDRIYLKIPVLGKIILENETFNFVFALWILTQSSLSLEKSLELAKNVIINSYLQKQVMEITSNIISGKLLSQSFADTVFPNKISSFIKVSEKTGNISGIFKDLSNYYFNESEKRIDRFISLIDPLFTVILGSILFLLILLFILPVLTHMGGLL